MREFFSARNMIVVLVFGLVLLFFSSGSLWGPPSYTIPYDNSYNSLLILVKKGYVTEVEQQQSGKLVVKLNQEGEKVLGFEGGGVNVVSAVPSFASTDLRSDILAVCSAKEAKCVNNGYGPTISGVPIQEDNGFLNNLIWILLPVLFLVCFFWFLSKRAQSQVGQISEFGRSKARDRSGNRVTERFSDVAGVEEAKLELQEVVDFLKEPHKFSRLGARIPRGVLLMGPPGCGKTLLAKAVAGETGARFFEISGSEFVEMFVGVGAARVRDLFEKAKRSSPAIVFIDEIDALGRQRGAGLGGSHDEREQTLNQILVEMDGFETEHNVIVMAATNRPDILDPALIRPGRFDRKVVVDRPDLKGRLAILQVHTKGKPLADNISLEKLAQRCPGFTGADVSYIVNEAAILAARRNLNSIGAIEFKDAIERAIAGPERKSRIISDAEKVKVAYHEGGHAVVQRILPKCDPVAKVTIVSRGMALGYTLALPEEDRYLKAKTELEDQIAGLLAGNAAEEIVFGDTTTGSSNDIKKATEIAVQMVKTYGMNKNLSLRAYGESGEPVFLGREISQQRDYSDSTATRIDMEIHDILEHARNRAREVLSEHRALLDKLAELLVAQETVETAELEKLFAVLPPKDNSRKLVQLAQPVI